MSRTCDPPVVGLGNTGQHRLGPSDGPLAIKATVVSQQQVAVGIDVGGTTIKAAVVTKTGQLLHRTDRPTPAASSDPSEIIGAIIAAGRIAREAAIEDDLELLGVGFGLAAPCLGDEWVVHNISTIPALEGLAIRPPLAQEFGQAIAIDMDSHASTVGALHFEPALSAQRLLLMCIGTGISCGIAIDGHLLRYMDGTCGETGHVIVDPTFESRCTCGGRGCLESVASGPAIERAAQMLLSRGATPDDTRQRLSELAVVARDGNTSLRAVFERAGENLGIGLSSLIHIFSPQLILLGGGVMEASDLILPSLRAAISEHTGSFFLRQVEDIRLADNSLNLGILGAASPLLFGEQGVQDVRWAERKRGLDA